MKKSRKLIQELIDKREDAFKKVYYSYYKLVFYQAYSILNNKEDAEDVSQNTFIKFMNNVDAIDDDSNIKKYLMMICKNEAIDLYRKNANSKEVFNDDLIDLNQKQNDDDKITVITTLNNTLEPEEAKIAVMKIVFDFTFADIAKEINQSVGYVQAKYYKIIEKLKVYYKENG